MIAAPEMQTPGCNLASAEENIETNAIISPAEACDKSIATLSARLTTAGFAVHRLDSGGFLVCRWGMSRHCPDARTLAGFAHQVGVR
jgi:hypothetical protein